MRALKLIIVVILLFFPWINTFSNTTTSDNIRVSDTELATIKDILKKEAPYAYFPEDAEIEKVGTIIGKNFIYRIFLSKLEWGNQRLTLRLLLFSEDWHYLGNYGLSEDPIIIQDNIIIFPFNKNDGNKIVFNSKKIPPKVYLDGEVIEFDNSLNIKYHK